MGILARDLSQQIYVHGNLLFILLGGIHCYDGNSKVHCRITFLISRIDSALVRESILADLEENFQTPKGRSHSKHSMKKLTEISENSPLLKSLSEYLIVQIVM